MKRILIPGLMLAAAFALTNCSEQLVPPVQEGDSIVEETVEASQIEEVPFEVFAQSEEVETKTSATGSKGYLKWEAGDALNVFHSKAGQNSYSKHGKFIVDTNNDDGAQKGLFIGNLILSDKVQLHENNDWFFLYPHSSGDTPTVTNNVVTLGKVTIGSAAGGVQYQKAANSKEHIAGENYPMYGKVQNLAKSKNPAANMKHLSALVAVKVVNEGYGGDITIEDVEFEAKEDIVGDFTLKMPASGDHTFTGQGTAEAKKAKVAFNNPETNFNSVTIGKNESTTLYLAVKPFTVKSGASLTIRVNGSARTVKMSKDINFEAGKVTTIKVPVKEFIHPTASDAITDTDFISLSGTKREITLSVNGTTTTGYILGDGGEGKVTIKGKVTDLIDAFDIGFFASAWNGQMTAMTVNKMNAWIHENGERIGIASYTPLLNAIKAELSDDEVKGKFLFWEFDATDAAVGVVTALLSSGIEREGMFGLTKFIAPQTITFTKIIENGMDDPGAEAKIIDLLVLDEEPIHKQIDAKTIDSQLFTNRFPGAKFKGLSDMINNVSSPEAITTADILFNKIQNDFAYDAKGNLREVPVQFHYDFVVAGVDVDAEVTFKGILDGLFKTSDEMCQLLRKLEVEVEIITCPYSSQSSDYGTKGSPKFPDAPMNPILLWGLDAYGPEN